MTAVAFRNRVPVVARSAWVAGTAMLVGEVELGDDVSVWFGAVLRADNDRIAVGTRSNIQDGCVLHVDPGHPLKIGRGVSVGHRAVLHGCTIGDDVLIGMGAIVMNGAHIGAGSIIGAGAVVPAGAEVPPRSVVVGVPGRVRATSSDLQVDASRQNAVDYMQLAHDMSKRA